MIWVVVLVCFLIALSLFKSINNDNSKEGVILSDIDALYIGGFSDLEGGKSIHLKVFKDKIIIKSNKVVQVGEDGFERVIPISDVLNIGIKSEQQLQNDVNLLRYLTLGVFSLGKQKNVINNFVVINYTNNNDSKNIVIKSSKNELLVTTVNKIKLGEA